MQEGHLHAVQHQTRKQTRRLYKSIITIARMPSQGEIGSTLPFTFFIDLEEGGQTRTKNDPATQEQRTIITNRGGKSPYKADVRLITCVHGRWSEEEPTLVSLVVFEYHVGCTGGDHVYASLETELTFTNHDAPNAYDKPSIKKWAPFEKFEMIDPIDVEYTKKTKVKGSVGASVTPANAGTALSTETEKKYKLRSFALGKSFASTKHTPSMIDTVTWELRQNKLKGVGVPDTFRVALLVQCANMDNFTGIFTLKLNAGLWHAATEAFKMGSTRCSCEDDPIIFNPRREPQGEITDINPSSLGDYAHDDKLKTLTPVNVIG